MLPDCSCDAHKVAHYPLNQVMDLTGCLRPPEVLGGDGLEILGFCIVRSVLFGGFGGARLHVLGLVEISSVVKGRHCWISVEQKGQQSLRKMGRSKTIKYMSMSVNPL